LAGPRSAAATEDCSPLPALAYSPTRSLAPSAPQLACLAIFGEYLGRTYMQLKGRPLYMIDEIVARTAPEARD
jgi:hypothetical protein